MYLGCVNEEEEGCESRVDDRRDGGVGVVGSVGRKGKRK